MASLSKPTKKPFRFMDLAPELRDMVFDELYDCEDVQTVVKYRFTVRRAPLASLLRVSKKFSREYADRIWKRPTLVFSDTAEDADPTRHDVETLYVGSLTSTQKVLAKLLCWCDDNCRHDEVDRLGQVKCTMKNLLSSHTEWMQTIRAPSMKIEIVAEGFPEAEKWHGETSRQLIPLLQSWADMPNVGEIRLLRTDFELAHDNDYNALAAMSKEVVTWTEKGGWQVPKLIEGEVNEGKADEGEEDESEEDESEVD